MIKKMKIKIVRKMEKKKINLKSLFTHLLTNVKDLV